MSRPMTIDAPRGASRKKLLAGFVAGFLAVLLFHQTALLLLSHVGFIHASVYSMHPTAPLGVPKVLSLAFWGGVWGVLFALIENRLPGGVLYWVLAILFGAIFPTAVAWFVVFPLKGLAVGGGWRFKSMATGLLINGAWGLGTAIFLALLGAKSRSTPV